ncbi:non-structural maintenance of chromosomes element 3 homolog [Lethenteron reissneri]|uniref:non-structural maintenance of chromosomes element 3 homolog n=1 Tax=Lethenteron reissneri TaxID=7753 RepID=UPI002AB7DCDE|nr:non-structural maintenance of chromosomes element 3 homolog [Lethenteron reissneri]
MAHSRTGKTKVPASQNKRRMDEDDDEPDSSMLSSQCAEQNISQKQLEQKVSEVIQYILTVDQKKIPIKKSDISKNVLKDHRSLINTVMKMVIKKLNEVFGMDLVEIDSKLHSFILVNNIPNSGEALADSANEKLGLLMLLLSIIFMKGGVLKCAKLWYVLKKFGIDQSTHHIVFGDVKKLIMEEFVRQKYLKCSRVLHTDVPEFEFRWGARAECEVTKMKVLEFTAKMYRNAPTDWASQYKEAVEAQS